MSEEYSIKDFEQSFSELKEQIEDAFQSSAKLEKKIRELGVKHRKHLKQLVLDMDKGASELHEYHTRITTDEIEAKKAAKKGKMFANSVKALGVYLEQARDSLNALMPLVDDVEDPSWSYDELKKWIRSVARKLEKIDKERSNADKVMGIDFMIKKRKLNRPLSQAIKQLHQLRDFLQKDYMLIKYQDDVTSLQSQIEIELNQLKDLYESYRNLLNQKSEIEAEMRNIDGQIAEIESSVFMKKLQDSKINLKKKELEITGKFNPYKKIFSNLVSSSRKGDISVSFELIGIARDYHDNPLEAFLKEDEQFTRIITLARNLLAMEDFHSKLKIRGKERNRLEGLINVNKDKLQQLKDEYLELQESIDKMLNDPQLKKLNDRILSLETKKEDLKMQVARLDEDIQIIESKLRELKTSFEEKIARIENLLSQIRSFRPEHVK